jgi:CRISPR-associated endoribonuclease Cas6
MPYSVDVPLKIIRTLPQGGGTPDRALNALLYHWISAADNRLGDFLHDQAEPKPFTMSPLIDLGNGQFRFRATLLEDQYGPYVSEGMKLERTVRIGAQVLAMNGEPAVIHQTHEELWDNAGTSPVVVLRFESPTSFKLNAVHYPLPDPVLVFSSYRARWNAFAPESMRIEEAWLEWVKEAVAVSRFELTTRVMDFERYQQIGCVGPVQYTVIDRGPEARAGRAALNALADYAFFCGTGHKTTQGLGQTRRLREWPKGG